MRSSRTVVGVFAWVAAALLIAACGSGNSEPRTATVPPTTASPTASPTAASPTPMPIATPSTEEMVAEAYLAYWEAYAQALFELDESRLPEVMAGPRLERALEEIESLRSDGRAVQSVLNLDPAVVALRDNEATVIDEYENASYLIDPETKEPVAGLGSSVVIREAFTLVYVDGAWKVFDSVRQVGSD